MFLLSQAGVGEIFYATTDSAGFDVCANEAVVIAPGEWKLIGTGLRILESNNDWAENALSKVQGRIVPEIQLRPRSGLAAKFGITILNAPSTIDADYRGEIKVNLINHSKVPFEVNIGDRIAQAICALSIQLPCVAVQSKIRGEGGFGSTGHK